MSRRRRINPNQLSLWETRDDLFPPDAPIAPPSEETSEEAFLKWLAEPAPMVFVAGANPHIVMVTTFRSMDKPVWLSRPFVKSALEKSGFIYKGKLKTGGNIGEVFRPGKKKGAS